MKQEYCGSSHPSAFIPHPSSSLYWYRRRDSNPHCLVSKTSASCPLGYAGKTTMNYERGMMNSSFIIPTSSLSLGGPGTI